MPNTLVVGIGGCTCAGKTTIASELNKELVNDDIEMVHICQDDFYKPEAQLQKLEHLDYWWNSRFVTTD